MKKLNFLIVAMLFSAFTFAQTDLNYYLPADITYDESIPEPAEFAGHQIGELHLTHDKIYYYMLRLAELSDRAIWEEYGKSNEGRPLGNLVISSSSNINNIEAIRKKHISLSDPSVSDKSDIKDMPVVVKLGYGVHGNESSAQNASVLIAYYLTAGSGEKIDELLENTIVLIDPSLNPDGLQRHSTWVNSYKSSRLNPDANSIEFKEAWPGGRTNHYWFDLNRDYIMLQQPESIGRVKAFHRWKPNINTDHHEMGASSSFFFQPGVRTRENPLTPKENYELVTEIAKYHIKYLDEIGSLYYSEESFDDFYLGKGSAYPDIHASIGILFEQAGVKGHLREVSSGTISFPFAIKNQVTVSLSTLEAGLKMKEKLLEHQVDFYKDALVEASKDPVKAYVFTNDNDKGRSSHFIENLLRHQIYVYRLAKDITLDGKRFEAENSYVVPMNQPEYRYAKSMFYTITEFKSETFYDISSWNLPMSFNLPFASYGSSRGTTDILGPRVLVPEIPEGSLQSVTSPYAYVFEWNDYYSPKALYSLLEEGITVKLAMGDFSYVDDNLKKDFKAGTIMIPVSNQSLDADALSSLMKNVVVDCGITIYGLTTGHTPVGIDLGSNSFSVLKKPEILMFIGSGSSSRECGEIWQMLDKRFRMPVTMVNTNSSVDLSSYNVIILTGASGFSEGMSKKIVEWTRNGGTLIAYRGGNSFVSRNKLASIETIPSAKIEPGDNVSYASRSALSSHNRISGAIFEVKLDITHPLCYGYTRDILPVFKGSAAAYKVNADPFSNPAIYSDKPLLTGFSSQENIERIAGSAFMSVHNAGSGRIVSFYDNTNFRAIWYGTTKLFMNSIFFGQTMGGRRSYE